MKLVSYIDKHSFFHTLDPRTKIVICSVIIVLGFVFNHPIFLVSLFGIVILLSAIAKINDEFFSRIKYLASVVIMSFLLWSIFYRWAIFAKYTESKIIISIGPIAIDELGLLYGVSMPFRTLTMIGTPLLFFMTTSFGETILALTKLKAPYKLAFSWGLAYRLIPAFADEWNTIKDAQLSRGLELEKGWLIKRITNHIPIVVPIFLRAFDIIDQLTIAMSTKAFGAYKIRTFYKDLQIKGSDYLLIVISIVLFAVGLWLRFKGIGVL